LIVLVGDEPAPAGLAESGRPILRARLEPIDGARFAEVRVVAFAGIGRPEKFFATLRRLGAVVVAARGFADPHCFTEGEIAALRREASDAGAVLVTTAKDWVRLAPTQRDGIETLEVELCWQDEAALTPLLVRLAGTS